MSSFSFEDGPEGPGLDPTFHPDFEDAPQFVDPNAPPSMFGVSAPGDFEPPGSEPIIPSEAPLPEDDFDQSVEQDIVGLLFLGFLQRTCNVYGHTFVLRSLGGAEDLAVAQIIDEQPGLASSGKALMYGQVAAALMNVDGRVLHAPLNDSFEQVVATIRKKIDYILQWSPRVVERLFEEYQELSLRVDAALEAYEGKLTAGRPIPQP